MSAKGSITVRIDDEQRAALERIGAELDRPVGWLIRAAIDDYVAAHDKPRRSR